MMVDFLSLRLPCILPRPIVGGVVFKLSQADDDDPRQGPIMRTDWKVMTRRELEGSWSTKCTVRAVTCSELEISGNVAKFLQGHNLYGPDDPMQLLKSFLARIQPILWPEGMPVFYFQQATLSRIDLTESFLLPRGDDVVAWLRAAHERGSRPYLGRGVMKGTDGSTLVYGDATGKRAKAWQVTFYYKGREIMAHPLPPLMMERSDVIEWCARLLRCEVRLRTAELKRLGKPLLADWMPEAVAAEWQSKVEKVDFMEETLIKSEDFQGIKPRYVDAYRAWQAGADLRQGRPDASWYRLKKDMRHLFGVDIAVTPPKSIVVPLRRYITATQATLPPWADEVAQLLEARAA